MPRRAGRRLRSRDLAFFPLWVYQGRRSGGGALAEGSAAEFEALEGRGQVGRSAAHSPASCPVTM